MENFTIKIKISDREYSLKIDPKDENILRQAGKIINEKLKLRQEKFVIHQKQDLLAMIAFDSMVENLKLKEQISVYDEKIKDIDTLITDSLD